MTGLSMGLFALASALLLAPLARGALTDGLWILGLAAALLVFVSDPRPFIFVLGWASVGVLICLSDRSGNVAGFVKAAVTGYLLGAAAAALPAVSIGSVTLVAPAIAAGTSALVFLAGFVQARWHGVAFALLSGALGLGSLDHVQSAAPMRGALPLPVLSSASPESGATVLNLAVGGFT